MKKDPSIFLKHIEECITHLEKHIKGMTKSKFLKNIKTQDAVIRRIEIIGEAAKNIPSPFKNKHAGIEWKEIAGMRNKLIHEYFGVNLDIVWKTAKEDMPKFKKKILKLLKDQNTLI